MTAGIKAYPEGGIDSRQVDAYASMAKIVAKWMTSAAQEKAVREMVMEGDPPCRRFWTEWRRWSATTGRPTTTKGRLSSAFSKSNLPSPARPRTSFWPPRQGPSAGEDPRIPGRRCQVRRSGGRHHQYQGRTQGSGQERRQSVQCRGEGPDQEVYQGHQGHP